MKNRLRAVALTLPLVLMLVGGIGVAEAKKPMHPRPTRPVATAIAADRPVPGVDTCVQVYPVVCGWSPAYAMPTTVFSARLSAMETDAGVAGKVVSFSNEDGLACYSVSDGDGMATCEAWGVTTSYTASFAGDDTHLASEDDAALLEA